uniref:medium-chain acyl-CoA ligase n=1 Tax=Monodelphis domestica TaxID=13616 RepID=F6V7C6_MONDO
LSQVVVFLYVCPVCHFLWYNTSGSLHPRPRNLLTHPFSRTETTQWGDYEIPKEFNFASDVLDHWAHMEKEGKRDPLPALWWVNNKGDEVKWNFRELSDLTRQAANVLMETCGLQQGDYLILILPRIPELWLLTVGCIRAGLVILPGTPQLTAKDILYRLQISKAKGIATTETLAPLVDSMASDCPHLKVKLLVSEQNQHLTAKCFFSLISLFKYKFLYFGVSRQVLKLTSSDVSWCVSDPGWILSVVGAMIEPWTSGSCSFIHGMPQHDPMTILQTLSRFPITSMLTSASVYRMLLQLNVSSYKFPTLKNCVSAGEVLLPQDFEKWKQATGLAINELYGQSETGITCAVSRGMKVKKGSMGKVVPPFDMQIIDEEGNILPPGKEGEMAIRIKPTRPIGLFTSYLNDPEKTSLSERGDFYITGDRAMLDEEGYIWYLGRSDDIINASGYRIGPSEVENALAEHPAVAESAVIASPDPIRGEVVKAFVVLTPEFMTHDHNQLAQELQRHVKETTAPYKYPRKVEFVPDLPKTVTGKIMRSSLRKIERGFNQ